ncbi:L-lactate dehydrogenase complex protein LldG [Abditibacterium utsteinense]|uniref:L-lactate dehydrogenase complex protein LldG n=1 Tax=Abditibacterium utsteinense TaxID=1960156 RepID=A0A2S8STS8_9BACT|nr:LUD domain-containing protein [Abditibacterium utsteinense]PQV64200.1 L-lactate dehydrogenase complex protein LldG [Abditibacterium utsteinense]
MPTTHSSRETILSQIRRALAVPAPKPGHHAGEPLPQKEEPFQNTFTILGQEAATKEKRTWLPPVGETWNEWADLFAANSLDLRTEWILCQDESELEARLEKLKTENGWKKIALHRGDLTERAAQILELETLFVDDGYDPHELEKCDAGITLCDALIAQTGSVLVTNSSSGGRVLAILPPHHVVIARREQMLPDLPAAFDLLQAKYGDDYPSLMGFITGPSRTGDIERILVLGAHGPKKLTILCV